MGTRTDDQPIPEEQEQPNDGQADEAGDCPSRRHTDGVTPQVEVDPAQSAGCLRSIDSTHLF